jgi:cysteinyl-tRNA synthetase
MTLTQTLLLILVLLAVAAIAYRIGKFGSVTATTPSTKPQSADISPPTTHATSPNSTPTRTNPAPNPIRSWGYQLQKFDMKRAAASPFDLLVIDPSNDGNDGNDESALKPTDLARLKTKPDGSRRLVLAYLSIGEAESYRGYWDTSWKKQKPEWLLAENPEWKENYAVCFWDSGWQSIMCGSADARLDRILAAGFDGVYLDKCDVYEDMRSRRMKEAKSRPNLESDMVAFVRSLSTYAKRKQPNFLVVMQNAEGLLDDATLRNAIDGVAKEELVFGVDQPEKRNSQADFDYSRDQLDRVKREGKMVLVVEYLNNQTKIDEAVRAIAPLGYTLYISAKNRELDRLNYESLIA